MSNLLKYNQVIVKSSDKLIIDSNGMVEALIAQQQLLKKNAETEPDQDGFIQGIQAATVEQLLEEEPQPELSQRAKDIIEDAHKEAEEILASAQKEAEQIAETARQEAYETGLRQGQQEAEKQLEKRRGELEKEHQNRMRQLEKDLEAYRAQVEPELVEALLTVFSKITHTIADDRKDIIYYLVDGVLHNSEQCKEYTIRVSAEDYNFLINNKDKLYGAANPDIRIDIVKDSNFKRNQCIIEADAGVFDCSLDIQLENLVEQIRLLSCLNDT